MAGDRTRLPTLESASAPRLTPRVFDPPLPSRRECRQDEDQRAAGEKGGQGARGGV